MELSQNPRSQANDNTAKPKTTSFFPLQKLKGNQPLPKMAAMHLVHLEEENTKRDEQVESKDPDSIEGVMEEFMVCLVRAMKDTQVEEKHCYHCSIPKHFICNCLLVRASRENMQLNCKRGWHQERESRPLRWRWQCPRTPRKSFLRCNKTHVDSILESRPLFSIGTGLKMWPKWRSMGRAARLSWTMAHISIPSHLIMWRITCWRWDWL